MYKLAPTRLIVAALLLAVSIVAPVYAATIEESQKPFLDLIRAPQAQQITKGEGVIVAVLDTGVDAGHPDLAGALLPGYHINAGSAEAANSDPDGHGTAMSGIIAARGGGFNNALGIAPQAKILPVAMDFNAEDTAATLASAIRWAVDNGATILNMSLARPSYDFLSQAEVEAVAYAQSKGAILIVSAGNTKDLTGGNNIAALPGVVPVAATTLLGDQFSGSEVRDYNAIAAPGEKIVITGARNVHNTGFVSDTGTSPATAVVSGVAALVRAKYPEMDAANVINRLIKTAVDKGEPGRDNVYGYGIVDAYAALTADVPTVTENPLGVATAPDSDGPAAAPSSDTLGTDIMGIVVRLAILGAVIFGIVLIVRARKKRRAAQAGINPAPPAAPYQDAQLPTQQPQIEPTPPAYPPTAPQPTTNPFAQPQPPTTSQPTSFEPQPQIPQQQLAPPQPPAPQFGQAPTFGPQPEPNQPEPPNTNTPLQPPSNPA